MKLTLSAVLILASSIAQLSYAEPWHPSADRKSRHQQLGNRGRHVQGQDNWLGGNGNWSNGNDWSLNAPPGSADDANIGGVNDYVNFDVGNATINSLNLSGTLTDNGIASQLTASSALNVTSTGVLDFASSSILLPGYMQPSTNYGEISAASLSIGTAFMGGYFDNHGVLNVGSLHVAAAGNLTNESDGTLTTTGNVTLGSISNAGQWDNYGAVSGGYPNGSNLDNAGVLNNHSGGTMHISYQDFYSNEGTFNNDGSITSDFLQGGGLFTNSGAFNNNGSAQIASFSNSGSIVNNGTFVIGLDKQPGYGGGTNTGSYIQDGPQSSTIVEGVLTTTTPLQINGGVLSGSGIIAGDVNMRGTLHPGDVPNGCVNSPCKTLTIQGNYQQFGIGTFYSQLGGTQAGTDYDQLVITGSASLDGILDVALLNNFMPQLGDTFFLMTYSSESGKFATLDLPSLPSGEVWDYAYEPNDFKLWVAAVPEPSSLALLSGGLLGVTGLLRRKRRP